MTPAVAFALLAVALPEGERIEISAAGRILDLAAPRDAEGVRSIFLLHESGPTDSAAKGGSCSVRAADGEPATGTGRRISRLVLAGSAELHPVRDEVDPSTSHVGAFDLDGDGVDELIVGRRGQLDAWNAAHGGTLSVRSIVSVPGAIFANDHGRPEGPVPASRLHVFEAGRVTAFGPREDGAGFAARGSTPLPVDARAGARSAHLRTLPFVPVGSSGAGGDVLVSDPEPVGDERLRVWRAEPERNDAGVVECWGRFPTPERQIDADYVILDGEPALVVTTMRSDKMQFFGEKRLRVFRIEPDRTRTGIAPILAAESGANLWQTVQARVTDTDGDGRDDLVLAYWKGLKDRKVEFEVWSRDGAGRWPTHPDRGTLDVPDGDRSFLAFGEDLDADGTPDLLVAGKGALRVHRGIRGVPGRLPVESDPAAVLALPDGIEELGSSWIGMGPDGMQGGSGVAGFRSPRPVDLDGDGVAEILLVDAKRPERLWIYRWKVRKPR